MSLANRSFLFYSSIVKPVITPISDLFLGEYSNTSISIVISLNYYSIIDEGIGPVFFRKSRYLYSKHVLSEKILPI